MVLALVVTPLILVRLYYYAISDIGAEPTPFPQPWLALLVGSALAFVASLFPSTLVVLLYRLTARRLRKGYAEPAGCTERRDRAPVPCRAPLARRR
jgi:hypothetical protein